MVRLASTKSNSRLHTPACFVGKTKCSDMTGSDVNAGVVWDGWGHASAWPRSLTEAAGRDAGRPLHGPASAADPSRGPRPYMQLAAVWLATTEAHAQAQCLLEAQLLSGRSPAAQQVSTS